MPVAVRADRRFRRAQVRPGRRAAWRTRWRPLLVWGGIGIGALTGVSAVVGYVGAAESLTIRRIAVAGNARLSTGEVHALLGDLFGSSMVTADIEASRRRLLAAPWVADVDVRRVFPSGLSVRLSEREAVALGRFGTDLYLIDTTGTIIDDEFGPNDAGLDLPIVDGLGAENGSSLLVDEARARLVARLLTALAARPDLASRVSQIDVGDPRDVTVLLKGDTALVRLGDRDFVERLESYVELAAALRDRVLDIDYVDLRYEGRVYVKPHAAGGTKPGRS
jgi:cell division protein FtsQ